MILISWSWVLKNKQNTVTQHDVLNASLIFSEQPQENLHNLRSPIQIEKTTTVIQHKYHHLKRNATTNHTRLTTALTPNHNEFLQLLHNKIASQQIYPEDAITHNQSGTVTLSFIIHPDGELEKLNILKSSTIQSLDTAAITAIRMISPIKEASEYLQHPQYLTVDVNFQI